MREIKTNELDFINGGLIAAGNLQSMITAVMEGVVIGAVMGGKYSTAGGSWTGGFSELLGIIVGPIAGGIAGLVGGFFVPDSVVKNVAARLIGTLLSGENSNAGNSIV